MRGGSSLKQIREKLHYCTVQTEDIQIYYSLFYVYDLHNHFLVITNFSKQKITASLVIDGREVQRHNANR